MWQEEKPAKMDKRLESRQAEVLNKHILEKAVPHSMKGPQVCADRAFRSADPSSLHSRPLEDI